MAHETTDAEWRAAWRDCCGVYSFNADHVCVVYDGPPCQAQPGCAEPTVSGFYGAPGVGRFTECKAGHHVGTAHILTPAAVR
jgi:hypothetical protein